MVQSVAYKFVYFSYNIPCKCLKGLKRFAAGFSDFVEIAADTGLGSLFSHLSFKFLKLQLILFKN